MHHRRPLQVIQLRPSTLLRHRRPSTLLKTNHHRPFSTDILLTIPHTLLTSIPFQYTYSIPLFALSLRFLLVGPLILLPAHLARRRQAQLAPGVAQFGAAVRKRYADRRVQSGSSAGPVAGDGAGLQGKVAAEEVQKRLGRVVAAEVKIRRTTLFKRYGCQRWKLFLPLLQFPVWLAAMETLRLMCGLPHGLWGMLLGYTRKSILGLDGSGSAAGGGGGGVSSTLFAAPFPPALVDGAAGMTAAAGAGGGDAAPVVSDLHALISEAHAFELSPLPLPPSLIPADPLLALESPLWLDSLLLPDPYYILPLTLSALLVYSVRSNVPVGAFATLLGSERRGRVLRRAMLVAAGCLWVPVSGMPAALVWYWCWSAVGGMSWAGLTGRIWPVRADKVGAEGGGPRAQWKQSLEAFFLNRRLGVNRRGLAAAGGPMEDGKGLGLGPEGGQRGGLPTGLARKGRYSPARRRYVR